MTDMTDQPEIAVLKNEVILSEDKRRAGRKRRPCRPLPRHGPDSTGSTTPAC
jgi:hypothetical protein